jgi:hypothetical protein
MARYHGGKGVVYLATTGSGTAVAAASLSQWSLDKATDKVEVTAFGDTNKTYVQGLPDVKGTLVGYFDSADDALFDGAESADGVKLYLYPSSLAPTIYHYGPAWLDGSISVDVKGAVSVNGSFVANGAWGRKP